MASELKPKAVLFDLYNTLIDIWSEEDNPHVWHNIARFVRYQGLSVDGKNMQRTFFAMMRAQRSESAEKYPEVDLLQIFRALLRDAGYHGPDQFNLEVTQLFRALSIRRFGLFPDALVTLRALQPHVRLGVVSDAQRAFLAPEMERLGLTRLFNVHVISGDHGFRKPDPRLFRMALAALAVAPSEAIYVGNNSYRDVCGAQRAGMRAVLIRRRGHDNMEKRNCHPNKTIRTLSELTEWLL